MLPKHFRREVGLSPYKPSSIYGISKQHIHPNRLSWYLSRWNYCLESKKYLEIQFKLYKRHRKVTSP
jgi:hypothetical protein